jgi:O-antigen ligase
VAGLSPVEAAVGARRRAVARPRERVAPAALALGTALLVVALGAADGGYFPTSWSWSSLAVLWLAALALLVRGEMRVTRLETVAVGAFAALAGWTFLSATWAPDVSQPLLEGQRTLLYAAVLLALLLVAERRPAPVLAGVAAGITLLCGYALGTRLFPDRFGIFDPVSGYRLSEPIGYWNGLGLAAAVGTLVAAGFATRAEARPVRLLAAAALVVLLPTLYFTFSRGAWLALAGGLAATLALERRRLRVLALLLTLAPAPALAVWLCSREPALRRDDTPLAQATGAGHRLALVLLGLAVLAAATALALAWVEPRVRFGRRARGGAPVAVVAAAAAGLVLALVHLGGPDPIGRRAYDAFNAPPPSTSGDLNSRLASFSGSWRSNMWRVAWRDYAAHPVLGSGAGSYERYWNRDRDIAYSVRDAHSLYLETLAELGPVGLALLALALAAPLVAAARARRSPLAPAAAGAYVAYLLHAGIDWDWELAAVTVAGLVVGGALMLAARGNRAAPSGSGRRRAALLASIAPVLGFVVFALVGNNAAESSTRALLSERFGAAEAAARTAARWTPWSPEPWLLLGQAQLQRGDRGAASASFRRALAKDDGDWEAWYGLALASRGAASRRALARALELDPLEPALLTARSFGLASVEPLPTAGSGVRR